MRHVDYLLVGQGIAGTMLAYYLLKRGKSILIVDEYIPSSASRVGAGVFNPVTGKRHVKTWMADTIFPFAEEAYLEMEAHLGINFYHPLSLVKVFSSTNDSDSWYYKQTKSPATGESEVSTHNNACILNEFGSVELQNTGYVDMVMLTDAFRARMKAENNLVESTFDHDLLYVHEDTIRWKEYTIGKIIYCDGYKAATNPYFSWLPFVLSKGEVITIHAENLNLSEILNRGVFVLPMGNDTYKVGATYKWNDLSEAPSDQGRKELCERLNQLISCPYTVINHQAGIRPTVKDRKPLLGLHPVHRDVAIFNGLGTKGVSQAPFLAYSMAAFLEEGKPLDKVCDIGRFYSYYREERKNV